MNKLTQRQKDKLVEASQNAIHFTVVGTYGFPLDMLRYDKCWPAREGDAGSIAATLWVQADRDSRRIEMMGLKVPTVGRWASFGWKVVEVNGERP